MNLIETTVLASASFPVAELKDYLRLGSGFTDDGAQDMLLETCLRAAMGAIEARTSRVLLERTFDWNFFNYRVENGGMLLPFSPVTWLNQFLIYDQQGNATSYSRNDFQILTDHQRPRLLPKVGALPAIPDHGWGLMRILAGHSGWPDIPANLRQAMLLLAASYYENRDVMVNGGGQMPLSVAGLLAPFQRIRLGGGA